MPLGVLADELVQAIAVQPGCVKGLAPATMG
jgi:hypothetical protein